jgi:hypothetical protein
MSNSNPCAGPTLAFKKKIVSGPQFGNILNFFCSDARLHHYLSILSIVTVKYFSCGPHLRRYGVACGPLATSLTCLFTHSLPGHLSSLMNDCKVFSKRIYNFRMFDGLEPIFYPIGQFHQRFMSAFAPIFLRQKRSNLKCKYKKA